MNYDARDDATNRPVSLNNEATPDAAVSSVATSAPTYSIASASTIAPDAHGGV